MSKNSEWVLNDGGYYLIDGEYEGAYDSYGNLIAIKFVREIKVGDIVYDHNYCGTLGLKVLYIHSLDSREFYVCAYKGDMPKSYNADRCDLRHYPK